MFDRARRELRAVVDRDPATNSRWEVFLCSPGLHAIWGHRLAHWFYRHDRRIIARFISHVNRFLTGVEIHPGAQLGEGIFIDHGMGIVIGETTEIGDNVTIYKGVVLGGTGKESGKRHPTIGHNVVISSNSIVLGAINIGNNVKIGAGSVVLDDVPDDCTVVGVPGRVVKKAGVRVEEVEEGGLIDPVADVLTALTARVAELEKQMTEKIAAPADEGETAT